MRRRPCSRAGVRSTSASASQSALADSAWTSARDDVPTAIGPNTWVACTARNAVHATSTACQSDPSSAEGDFANHVEQLLRMHIFG